MTRLLRGLVLAAFGLFFFVPLWSMVDYSLRDFFHGGRLTLDHWKAIFTLDSLVQPLITSLEMSALTVALMLVLLLPTMIWVRLRVPQATRLVEFLCLLPLTIPPMVIVVGMTNVYSWVYYLIGFGPLTLTFIYVILVLPYSYRAVDSALSGIDVTTLAEAARSLGAGWFTVIARVISPNIRTGVVSAVFLTISLVMGEYTVAILMGFTTLPTALNEVRADDGGAAMAMSFAIMLVLSLLMVVMMAFSGRRDRPVLALTLKEDK
ncbi:ABC transporter permease [Nocardioides sp. Kera G14]|uniref:ABC transporter permease n=1 Tax=Nocardioides sp. Kera G14 TaxID=2884264 RepID=UPI001D118362|nr:ABC transporter permease subunit [Nocardioides sp. Kera G14]UDY22906.1 ABC transporter permease subunit [Nocardioides sp. Kera G14]